MTPRNAPGHEYSLPNGILKISHALHFKITWKLLGDCMEPTRQVTRRDPRTAAAGACFQAGGGVPLCQKKAS